MSSPTQQGFLDAAKLTVGLSSLQVVAMVYQTVAKQRVIVQKRNAGQVMDRYDCPELLNADRLAANLVEWALVFLGPVWSLAAVDRLDDRCRRVAWSYVSLRAMYVVLLIRFGVARGGRNKPLWISTFPSYVCLTYLFKRSLEILLL